MHTLYVSPLKALTTDIARNLTRPVEEMGLQVRIETRTGDTPQNRRARQRSHPPDLLLTTPESLALLLSYDNAAEYFSGLRCVVLDELHALAESKRGALFSLAVARLRRLAPQARFVGLSATVAVPARLQRYLSPRPEDVTVVQGDPGAEPEVALMLPAGEMPWAGHMAVYAVNDVYRLIQERRVTLVFVNTRAQAELMFGALWRLNKANLPIALHHGSLAVEQRRKVEAAMAAGRLRAVVCTSSLDLGIDWGDIDLVVQVGAPKGAARLLQRIGRANHRLDEPSQAALVPANRFEVLECIAAQDALAEHTLDGGALFPGGFDVLAQHLTGVACAGAFDADLLYAEVRTAAPFADLARADFDAVLAFVATGGYALATYDRYRRLAKGAGRSVAAARPEADPPVPDEYRHHRRGAGDAGAAGTRQGAGRGRGVFRLDAHARRQLPVRGRLLEFQGIRNNEVIAGLARSGGDPKIPAYAGGKLPLTTHLADRVRRLLADPSTWHRLPQQVGEWLAAQARRSQLTASDELLVETFARGARHYLVAYCFAGRNAHQTLGMLLTRRMERRGLRPLGFVASDYCIATWGAAPVEGVEELFAVEMLGDDLEEWMAESSLIKRTFRNCAVVAGLIERRHPGQEKTGRQVTFSADLIYDVLRKYDPDHVLLRAARAEAAAGLTDIRRLADLLVAVEGRIRHVRLDRISPFAVSIIAGIGKEFVSGETLDESLDEAVAELVAEAMGGPRTGPTTVDMVS